MANSANNGIADSRQPRHACGIDLGGSSAKIGIVADTGALVASATVPLPNTADAQEILAPVAAAAARMLADAAARALPVVAIGCGVPGNLDEARATVLVNNILALDGFALRDWLAQRFALPVVLDNDACMAALAEAWASPATGERTLVVTVGSGIGVALVVGGAILRIAHGATGEAGHIIVAPRSRERCLIGCRGCLETVASARAIEREALQAASSGASPRLADVLHTCGYVGGADVAVSAAAGDRKARAIIKQAGRWLGMGMASWAAIYAPTQIIIGGGVAQAGTAWLNSAIGAMRRHGVPAYTSNIRVELARLGPQAGMVGAALAAL